MADGLTRTASETAPQVKNAETGIFCTCERARGATVDDPQECATQCPTTTRLAIPELDREPRPNCVKLSSFVVVELVLLFCPEQKTKQAFATIT